MDTLSVNGKRGMEICKNGGRMLVDEIDPEDAWNRVEQTLADCLPTTLRITMNMDASDLTDKLEGPVDA